MGDVLHAIILICEHSLNLPNVTWAHDTVVWNNLVFKSLKHGYQTEITEDEKTEVLTLLNLLSDKTEFDTISKLDEFFFKVLEVLHDKYKDENSCINAMIGDKNNAAPLWANFNKYQVEMHLKQLEALG